MLKKELVIYGIVAGIVIIIMQSFEAFFWSGMMRFELYVSLAAITFLVFGFYLGSQWISKNSQKKGQKVIAKKTNDFSLSSREEDVLELMIQGLSNQEIADSLHVSLPTVKTHISNLYQKIGVNRRVQAVQLAQDLDLLSHRPKG